ncbi:hypothetical protein [Lysobacter enzymogenes]|uniref:hypothetical protein n=1 Tax=Lysobacter enzymogenes TaxID=69 RepID=UPI001A978144|nr:hypothetical protein [Lysobacter enzymogenes]QQP96952.1 hypothetical protein JHW38_02535 [Lysobacter enzymogenes]
MSSYNCVMPVDWRRLWGELVPAWLELLAGRIGSMAFRARYLPHGSEYPEPIDPQESYGVPARYLALFAQRPLSPPYVSEELRASWGREPMRWQLPAEVSEFLLLDAIRQSAAVDLPGEDRYASDIHAVSTYHGGRKQVAGVKNLFPFVRSAYELDWQREKTLYECVRRPGAGRERLFELLEDLLLYRRTLPGDHIALQSPSWPAHDYLSYAGYLAPAEVAELDLELQGWQSADNEGDLSLALFADRVGRSADAGYGLLTIHAGW